MPRFEKDDSVRRLKKAGTRTYAPEKSAKDDEFSTDDVGAIPVPAHMQQTEMSSAGRIAILGCIFLLACMILFVLFGYERITRAYTDVNTLEKQIDDVKLHISELNVSIECAVTIEQAEKAALAAGMVYPTRSQILATGEAIPDVALTSGSLPEEAKTEEVPD